MIHMRVSYLEALLRLEGSPTCVAGMRPAYNKYPLRTTYLGALLRGMLIPSRLNSATLFCIFILDRLFARRDGEKEAINVQD
jgi:hypothetical protein